jgi:thiosulfate dehydrogenase (quinone) large subunit
MSNESSSTESCCSTSSNTLALVYGSLLARLWLGVRAIQTGVEKYAGTQTVSRIKEVDGVPNPEGITEQVNLKIYALSSYKGVPPSMMSTFRDEPLMLKFALPLYDKLLGPALLLLGLTILLGIGYRTSLFLLGLLYISLTWGLILIKQDDGVSWLAAHMILIIAALALAQYNRLAILKKW